ncbi:hypothetical protein AN901_201776 [Pseudomonas syringae pv. theae]|uniref:Uncharacterized protein n=1 Tax=Pseudomonas syringae pv. theae TaxID=103985 RepID=A0A0Q0G6A7_PSESX|nr:hypothetical protein AN901_201776 [Pseudomonas syringae pv. theae]RMT75135.1 hypothetical protein ALP44_102331 [Pseudomonas syringae pv. theae]
MSGVYLTLVFWCFWLGWVLMGENMAMEDGASVSDVVSQAVDREVI